MDITRTSTVEDDSRLGPEGGETLTADFNQPLYNAEYRLRPPLALYNVSIGGIASAFNDVLDSLDGVTSQRLFTDSNNIGNDKLLLEPQERLLYRLMEHWDDCTNVLQCFHKERVKGTQAYKRFNKANSVYRDHIGRVVNSLKHSQGRLRLMVAYNEIIYVPGYFVEGIDEKGVLGPHLNIHDDGTTGFSFARDLRYHFCNLYFLSKILSDIVIDLTGNSRTPRVVGSTNEKWYRLAERIADLPSVFYRDERKKPVPWVEVHQESDIQSVRVSYPGPVLPVWYGPKKGKILVVFRGDGESRTFRFPY